MASSGFSRGNKYILPDIESPADKKVEQSAVVEIEEDGEKKEIVYDSDKGFSEHANHYVYDVSSVPIQISRSNTVSFSPMDLSILNTLVHVIDELQRRITNKVNYYSESVARLPLVSDNLYVQKVLNSLSPNTDTHKLAEESRIKKDEAKKLEDVEKELAGIMALNIKEKVEEIKMAISELENLKRRVKNAEDILNEANFTRINVVVEDFFDKYELSKKIGLDDFKNKKLKSVGTEAWHKLIHAASDMADIEDNASNLFPQKEDVCPLCQQKLDSEAKVFLIKLLKFVREQLQAKLDTTRKSILFELGQISSVSTNFVDEKSYFYRFLLKDNKKFLSSMVVYSAALTKIKNEVSTSLGETRKIKATFTKAKKPELKYIDNKIVKLGEELKKTNASEVETRRLSLLEEGERLRGRQIVAKNISSICGYVKILQWLESASKNIKFSTNHVSIEYGKIFEEAIGGGYIKGFEKILEEIGMPAKVSVSTKNDKGVVLKQIVISTKTGTLGSLTPPSHILSDGEKDVIALADFLTEVNADDNTPSLILDDPVTSLDCDWKEDIARVLVKESKLRQVIIFTHDLEFFYFLKQQATKQGVESVRHSIRRGPDDIPGYIHLNSIPDAAGDAKEQLAKAEEMYKAATTEKRSESEIDSFIKSGVGYLRTACESLIVDNIVGKVVGRYEPEVRVRNLLLMVTDKEIIDKVVEKHGYYSRFIIGHLPVDKYGGIRASCTLLHKEIGEMYRLFKEINKKSDELMKIKKEKGY